MKLIITAAVLFSGIGFSLFVPIGEGPDEQAHIAYINNIVSGNGLPVDESIYTRFHPPLDYIVSAALLWLTNKGPDNRAFFVNPKYPLSSPRKFIAQQNDVDEVHIDLLKCIRVFRLFWVIISALTIWIIANWLLDNSYLEALVITVPFILCPQFLFVSSTLNNDGAIVMFMCIVFFLVLKLNDKLLQNSNTAGRYLIFMSCFIGFSAGFSIFCKSSAIIIWPLLVETVRRVTKMGNKLIYGLFTIPILSMVAMMLIDFNRFGVLWKSPPIVAHGSLLGRLVQLLNPWWVMRIWGSFWGNFGWLSVKLPLPLYIVFLPSTCFFIWGVFITLANWKKHQSDRMILSSRLAFFLFFTNFLLVIVYMVNIDWQPQGRYLFPSIPGIIVLSITGWKDLQNRFELMQKILNPIIVGVVATTSLFVTFFSVYWTYIRLK